MVRKKNDIGYWILSHLEKKDLPLGAGLLLEEIKRNGIEISEATIGRQLRSLRSKGALNRVGNQGHCITQQGRELLNRLKKERGIALTLENLLVSLDSGGPNGLMGVLVARRALEREAVRQATLNSSDKELDEIESIVQTQYKKMSQGEEYADASSDFHRNIFKISHVPLLETLYTFIVMSTTWQNFFIGMFNFYDIPANLAHEKILQAMKSRDPNLAADLMTSHIDDVITSVRKLTTL